MWGKSPPNSSTSSESKTKLRSETGDLLGPYEKPKRVVKKSEETIDSGLADTRNFDITEIEDSSGSDNELYTTIVEDIDQTILNNSENKFAENLEESTNNVTMAENTQFITIKDAVAIIPKFEGSPSDLSKFIQKCEMAKEMLPSAAETSLTRIIQGKCLDEGVQASLCYQKFNNLNELFSKLKKIYTITKNKLQIQGELAAMFQKDNESVVKFAGRLKDKGQELIELFKVKKPNFTVAEMNAYKTKVDDYMKECFLDGLKPEIENRMRACNTMTEAFDMALEIEQKSMKKLELRGKSKKFENTGTVAFVKNNYNKNSNSNRGQSNQNPQNNRSNKTNQENVKKNAQNNSDIVCQICKKKGHAAQTCYARQNKRQSNEPCQICKKTNHTAITCYFLNKNQNEVMRCQLCNRVGHTADKCRNGPNQSATNDKTIVCNYCKKSGHLIKDCRARPNSGNEKRSFQSGSGKDSRNQRPIRTIREVDSDDDSL